MPAAEQEGSDSGSSSKGSSSEDEGSDGEAAALAGADPLVLELMRRSERAATRQRRNWASLHESDDE